MGDIAIDDIKVYTGTCRWSYDVMSASLLLHITQ